MSEAIPFTLEALVADPPAFRNLLLETVGENLASGEPVSMVQCAWWWSMPDPVVIAQLGAPGLLQSRLSAASAGANSSSLTETAQVVCALRDSLDDLILLWASRDWAAAVERLVLYDLHSDLFGSPEVDADSGTLAGQAEIYGAFMKSHDDWRLRLKRDLTFTQDPGLEDANRGYRIGQYVFGRLDEYEPEPVDVISTGAPTGVLSDDGFAAGRSIEMKPELETRMPVTFDFVEEFQFGTERRRREDMRGFI